jgi:cytoskeletal protein CcmA (bactofilin family)
MFSKDKKIKTEKIMEINVLAKNTTIVGSVKSEGDFRIDGTLDGSLVTNGRVIIGIEGLVKGDVQSTNANIEGKFIGKLQVNNTLAIKATANINGELVVGKLSVEPGAVFNAKIEMKGAVKELKQSDKQKIS